MTIENLRILTIYAHPDDESFGPSDALAKYARAGAEIYGLFATSGEEGNTGLLPKPSPAELARLRERDTRDAAAIIGYREIFFLGYYDGRVDQTPTEQLRDHLLQFMSDLNPEVLITLGPAGITRHPDHLAVHRAATAAFHEARARGIGLRELYYDAVSGEAVEKLGLQNTPDGEPNTWIDITGTREVKLEALRCHARHIIDAEQAAERVASELNDQRWATFHRAFPPVPIGVTLSGFAESIPETLGN